MKLTEDLHHKLMSKKVYLILLLPAGVLLSYIGSFFPQITERHYSLGINRQIIGGLSNVSSIFPFSLGEMLLILLVFIVLGKLVQSLIVVVSKKRDYSIILKYLLNLSAFLGVIYLTFILLWGLNYNRLSFAAIAHLNIQPATTAELADVCDNLIDRTNRLRMQLDVDQDGVMQLASGKTSVLQGAGAGYVKAAGIYPELGGSYGPPKGILLSEPMSYLGLTGVYSPFTGEANVNMAVPDAMLPSTAAHEMAHQRGFAREDEANYIAYFTCNLNPDPDFQYSGNLLAVMMSMNMLRVYDMDKYIELQAKFSGGVKKDLNYYSLFWKKHETRVGEISNAVNDLYLKSNRQHDGVYSYNRMVDLLIAEFRSNQADLMNK